MAHIVSFEVEGLAGRTEPYTKNLNRDVNVFFGLNGSGKTTLLKILHSALSNDTRIVRKLPFRSAKVEVYSLTHKQTFARTYERPPEQIIDPLVFEGRFDRSVIMTTKGGYITLPGAEQIQFLEHGPVSTWQTTPAAPEVRAWPHEYLPITRLYRELRGGTEKRGGRSDEELDQQYAATLQQVWRDYTSDVNRSVRRIQEKAIADLFAEVLWRSARSERPETHVEADKAYDRVSQFFKRQPALASVLGPKEQFALRYNDDPSVRAIVREIEDVENTISLATKPQEDLKNLLQAMFSGDKRVIIEEKQIQIELSNQKIDLPALSSGEKQLLLICIETLLADVNTLIIDEPELSMHVDWQRALLPSLMRLNPKLQIIAATHSPEIMADLADEQVFRM
jgi:energy-coupling factor transporter ATP-binding protein EcfA2